MFVGKIIVSLSLYCLRPFALRVNTSNHVENKKDETEKKKKKTG